MYIFYSTYNTRMYYAPDKIGIGEIDSVSGSAYRICVDYRVKENNYAILKSLLL